MLTTKILACRAEVGLNRVWRFRHTLYADAPGLRDAPWCSRAPRCADTFCSLWRLSLEVARRPKLLPVFFGLLWRMPATIRQLRRAA